MNGWIISLSFQWDSWQSVQHQWTPLSILQPGHCTFLSLSACPKSLKWSQRHMEGCLQSSTLCLHWTSLYRACQKCPWGKHLNQGCPFNMFCDYKCGFSHGWSLYSPLSMVCRLLDHQTWQEHPANSLQGHCWLTSKHYIYHFTFTATLETSLGHREFPFHPTDTSKHEGNALRSLWGLPRLLVLLVVVSGRRDSARLFPPIWADDGEASRWQSWQSKGWITWMNQSVPQS